MSFLISSYVSSLPDIPMCEASNWKANDLSRCGFESAKKTATVNIFVRNRRFWSAASIAFTLLCKRAYITIKRKSGKIK